MTTDRCLQVCPSCAFQLANLLRVHLCIHVFPSEMSGALREQSECDEVGMVGVVRWCRKGGCDEKGIEKEVVGECWGWHVWKGWVRVEGWHWLREAIANNQKSSSSVSRSFPHPHPPLHTPAHTYCT